MTSEFGQPLSHREGLGPEPLPSLIDDLIADQEFNKIEFELRSSTMDPKLLNKGCCSYGIGDFQSITIDPEPIVSFTYFPRLPPEIRCVIWAIVTRDPRVVPIMYDLTTTSYRPRLRPPPILQTNKESRFEALKVYRELQLGPSPNVGCYINPIIDSIYLRSPLDRLTNRIGDDSNIEPWQRGRLITTSPAAANVLASGDASPASSQNTPPDQANVSDPSDIEARDPAAPNPEMLRSRRHAKIILDDLIHSPDREIIHRDFHINYVTWDLMKRYYRNRRHQITCHIKSLSIVFEKGYGQLKSDFTMQIVERQDLTAEGDPAHPNNDEENRSSYRLIYSLKSCNSFVNWRDEKAGRPVVLNHTVCGKTLNLGNLDIPEVPEETASETGWLASLGLQFPETDL